MAQRYAMTVAMIGNRIHYLRTAIAIRQGCSRENATMPYLTFFADDVLIEGSLTIHLNIETIKTASQGRMDMCLQYMTLFVSELQNQPRLPLRTNPPPSLPAPVPFHIPPAGTINIIRQIMAAQHP